VRSHQSAFANLTKFNESEIKRLHGIGPHALKKLYRALMAKRKSFAKEKQ
jgi:ERCC4-type nuclease